MKKTRNENPKYEIPNYKQIPNSNVPIFKTTGVSRLEFVVCNLVLVWYFGFGACDFNEFSVSFLPRQAVGRGVAKKLCG
jgi:hypothetical protein